jgi:hypothetical protein
MAKKRIRLIYPPENPIWVGNENGKKGPVNHQMAGLVKSSEIW